MAGLAGCSGEVSPVEAAQAQVTAAEKAVTEAEATLKDASDAFCQASETYIVALDRYGDVLNDTEPDRRRRQGGGSRPRQTGDKAFDGAQAAARRPGSARAAQQELVDAQVALESAKAGPRGRPARPHRAAECPPGADGDSRAGRAGRVGVRDRAELRDRRHSAGLRSEQFNSAAVALEVSWLRLFADAGCLPEEQKQQAAAAVAAYTATLQQSLTDAGYYAAAVDGVYGPETVAAVEALQTAHGLPVTGTVDKATADALQADLEARARRRRRRNRCRDSSRPADPQARRILGRAGRRRLDPGPDGGREGVPDGVGRRADRGRSMRRPSPRSRRRSPSSPTRTASGPVASPSSP